MKNVALIEKYKFISNNMFRVFSDVPLVYIYQVSYINHVQLLLLKKQLQRHNLALIHLNQKTINLLFGDTVFGEALVGNIFIICPLLDTALHLCKYNNTNKSILELKELLSEYIQLTSTKQNQAFTIVSELEKQFPEFLLVGMKWHQHWIHRNQIESLVCTNYMSSIVSALNFQFTTYSFSDLATFNSFFTILDHIQKKTI